MDVVCPLCSTTAHEVIMDNRSHNGTEIYVCPECPAVLLEYQQSADLAHLRHSLEGD